MHRWYEIQNKGGDTPEIVIFETIGEDRWGDGLGAKRFIDDLNALGDIRELTVRINSPGGNVFDGTAIYNVLRNHRAHVTVQIDGIAASIASVIAMAGDTVAMPDNAMLMVHDPSGLTIGSADDMRKTAEALDKVKESLISAYVGKTGQPRQTIAEWMRAETWFAATEAKDAGFADVISGAVQMAAHFDLSMFRNAPAGLGGDRVVPFNPRRKTPMAPQDLERAVVAYAAAHTDALGVEQLVAEEWRRSAELRAEFHDNESSAVAYFKAFAAGRTRVCGQGGLRTCSTS